MKRRLISILLGLGLAGCAARSLQTRHDAAGESSSVYAHLTNTTVVVYSAGCGLSNYDISAFVEIGKVWSQDRPAGSFNSFIKAQFGPGAITYVAIPETAYWMILLDGAVQPAIYDVKAGSLWYLHGLGKYFPTSRGITPVIKGFAVTGMGGAGVELTWGFDFSDPVHGLAINYMCRGGG